MATFYKFVTLSGLSALQRKLRARGRELRLCGTVLIAEEGLNGTVCGEGEQVHEFLRALSTVSGLEDLTARFSGAMAPPFQKFKVRLKREIVTLGQADVSPVKVVGDYIEPEKWNELIQDPEVLLIDTRNDYEVAIGTFQGALNPGIESFREFPEYVAEHLDPARHRQIAMFCTGGIRCEKASSYLLGQGFEKVYHLKGGILSYLEQIPEEQSTWRGECFVFDERVSVSHGLKAGGHEICWGCGRPLDNNDKQSEFFEEGICCAICHQELTPERRRILEARKRGREEFSARQK